MNIISIVWNILVCLALYKDPTLRSSMNFYKTVPVSGVCWPFRHGCYSGDLWVEEFSIGTCESSELIITTSSFLCLNARFDWVAFCFCQCCILFSLVTWSRYWSRYDFIPVYIKEFKVKYLSLDLENRIAQYCTAFLTFFFYHYPSVSSVTMKFSWTFVSTIVVSFCVGFLLTTLVRALVPTQPPIEAAWLRPLSLILLGYWLWVTI